MIEIEKSVSNWIVKPTQESVTETFEYIKNNYSEFQKNHIIIDFSKKINIRDSIKTYAFEISTIVLTYVVCILAFSYCLWSVCKTSSKGASTS